MNEQQNEKLIQLTTVKKKMQNFRIVVFACFALLNLQTIATCHSINEWTNR